MNSASLCSLSGRYDNPIPTLFLAPIDCLKNPTLACHSYWLYIADKKQRQLRNMVELVSGFFLSSLCTYFSVLVANAEARARICKLLRSTEIDSASPVYPGGQVRRIGLSHRPARPHRLTESIPWNRFLGSLKVYKFVFRISDNHRILGTLVSQKLIMYVAIKKLLGQVIFCSVSCILIFNNLVVKTLLNSWAG
jgi:hypothetical protein